jgi:hypothetical protein
MIDESSGASVVLAAPVSSRGQEQARRGVRYNHVTKWFGLLALAAALSFVASVSPDDNVGAVLSLPRQPNLNAGIRAS